MSESQISRKDYIIAEALSLGSAVQNKLPALRRITQNADMQVPVRWRHIRVPVDFTDNWLMYEPASGNLPKNYAGTAVIGIPREPLDRLQKHTGERHAVAYRLGTAVMAGIMIEQEIFGETEDQYLVAMGIGNGPLQVTAGLWIDAEQELWVPNEPLVKVSADQVDVPVPYV